jgi:hypothetical protein
MFIIPFSFIITILIVNVTRTARAQGWRHRRHCQRRQQQRHSWERRGQ